jgi:uncharacterized repeat protein (TIGR01451 family)
MKKIISLTVPFGILAILFTFIILYTPASQAASTKLVTTRESSSPEQGGPPWFDGAWHYRRSITISNNGASLSYYQVLIRLDSSFNFSQVNTNGSDIRFTHSDGTTELKYWIESWDSENELAYVWVRVPSLGIGNTNIYLYYNNPEATPVSDGPSTFDSFEDNWSQFTGEGFNPETQTKIPGAPTEINSPFVWSTISGSPDSLSGILNLEEGDGIKSTSTYLYNALGLRANFGLGNGYEWVGFINEAIGQRTMIGDLPTDPGNLYLIDYRNNHDDVLLPRVGGNDWHNGYHVYEVRWSYNQSIGDIDHGVITGLSTQPSQVPNINLPVTLFSNTGSNATLKVDWVYVRQYRDPEPTYNMGAEQGLVELSIGITDSPDPVRMNARLTYLLTISNTSTINSPGVMVTDTLPMSVTFGSVNASQGSCDPGSVILCDLTNIPANSIATITIVVTTTEEGEINNTAVVGSPGYELDLSDNASEQATFVDSQPPVVEWEEPVKKGQLYYAFGNMVTLEASATDVGGVAWVEFKLWDHIAIKWISIGTDTTYPYQAQFNSSILAVNDPYQMFVVGVDRAGNQSNPYDPLQVIYIERRLPVYLPLLRK